jgi:uncharacterized protein
MEEIPRISVLAKTNPGEANGLRRSVDLVGRLILVLICLGVLLPRAMMAETSRAEIDWQPWTDAIFEKARKEHRIELIRQRYVAVRVDQDARPDLSNRYEDYGWPATIVFNSDGSEIVKRQGYIPPKPMASMLQAIIDDPSPGPSIVAEPAPDPGSDAGLKPEQRDRLRKILRESYDSKNRGWGTVQKYLDWDIIEYCQSEAMRGEQEFERMARETLDAQRQLIDPVWGGVYQYSTDGDWKHPHFEKIMQMQAENLRSYAQAYALWKDPAYLEAAKKIREYLRNFLTSSDGAFFTSQDADLVQGEHSADYFALSDADRRKRGIPRVDQHVYARENGWAINAMATLYGVTGDASALADAIRSAEWIIANRSLPGGGFRHDAQDASGPYLGDSIYMGRAFLKLYAVTGDRKWLRYAEETAGFVEKKFKSDAGYAAFVQPLAGKLRSKPQVDENVATVRTFNLLHCYTGKEIYRKAAQHAMRYLASPTLGENRGYGVAGLLLADRELGAPPLHLTVVGKKDDSAARSLFMTMIALPSTYKRVEWWDEREGPMPNPDVQYPKFEKPAAFVCTDRRCSAPIFDPAKIPTLAGRK